MRRNISQPLFCLTSKTVLPSISSRIFCHPLFGSIYKAPHRVRLDHLNCQRFGLQFLRNQIFSSFSWGDILTQNMDSSYDNTNIFAENNYVPLPMNDIFTISPTNENIFMIQDSDDDNCEYKEICNESDDDEDSDESDESDESEACYSGSESYDNIDEQYENSSWIYIPTSKKPTIDLEESKNIDIDSYSFNFDSTTDESINKNNKTTCEDISLDSSISSESLNNNIVASPVSVMYNIKF